MTSGHAEGQESLHSHTVARTSEKVWFFLKTLQEGEGWALRELRSCRFCLGNLFTFVYSWDPRGGHSCPGGVGFLLVPQRYLESSRPAQSEFCTWSFLRKEGGLPCAAIAFNPDGEFIPKLNHGGSFGKANPSSGLFFMSS